MKDELFDIRNFNVIEDNEYYYIFRALNRADHDDIINHFLETNQDPERIRTDRERYEAMHGRAKYDKDSEISLEEVYDHIKMHYLKETNCISLSSNSSVALDYGGSYYDEYAVIKVPKDNSNINIYPAGQYMLFEVFIKTEEALESPDISPNIREIINYIDNSSSNEEIIKFISELVKTVNYERQILSRFQDRQYFSTAQQLEYNKIIAKATILEIAGILPSIIDKNNDNQSLLATIGSAFSSGELVHYKDIPKESFKIVSKRMMNLFSLTQQLKEKLPNNRDVLHLEQRLTDLVNKGYDIREINGEVFLTNGTDTIKTGLIPSSSEIFNKSVIDPDILSVDEIYNMTGGTISYAKAKKAIEFCYTLARSRKEVYDYSVIISSITGNNNLINELLNKCFIIDSKIIDRSNNNGYQVCESVNIGIDGKGPKYYTLEEQGNLINLVLNQNLNNIEMLLQNKGTVFRNTIIENFDKGEVVSRNEYYASSIIDAIDFTKIYRENQNEEYLNEIKDKLSKLLSLSNISRIYNAFTNLELSHEEISYYIFNLFIEKRLKGHSFEEICELSNIDEFIKDNFSVFNRDINALTLNNYLGIFTDSNYVPNSQICLRDFQQRIKNDVDKIHSNNRRFAGVIVPTGGGKSFIAMAEMMDRQDSKILYVAPRINILRNFKKNIVKYVADLDPEGLADDELDIIVKSCFPYLELICYQSLNPKDEEKLASYKADYIILDEIHHIGGASWNRVVKKLVDNNPTSQVLGISATPQRDDYKDFEGDDYFDMYNGDMMMAMAAYLDDYTPEELRQKIYLASDINIIDAIQEGYVVCPNIVSFDYSLDSTNEYKKVLGIARKIREPLARKVAEDEIEKILSLISNAKLNGLNTVINQHLKVKNGKYILFVPRKPSDYNGTTDDYIEEYIEEFKENIADIDKAPHINYIHSGRGDKKNIEVMREFEIDDSDHMKVLVAIDMLNEGVHLPNINGSFNFRKIDDSHLILSLQHLGRVIYALDPSKEYTDSDTPIVFDKFNNYSNLDFDRLVNKKSVTSDLEKLKDAIFWIEKYGRFPNVEGTTKQEVRKAITLKRIQEKYKKFLTANLEEYNLSEYDKKNTEKIIEICNKYNIWDVDFGEISREETRKIDRVELFNVSSTQNTFLNICNKIKEMAGISILKTSDRLKLLIQILDILAENDILLNPNTIQDGMLLEDLLKNAGEYEMDSIMFELDKLAVTGKYPIGIEYYFGRNNFFNNKSIFSSYEYNFEEITALRKYGIICNGPDFKFIDDRGFVISGPRNLLGKNIWTGTFYDKDHSNIEGYDKYNFNIKTKIHKVTNDLYNEFNFDINRLHRDTNDYYDKHGFDIDRLHKDTGTIHNKEGFDINGNWYKMDPTTKQRVPVSYSKYDEEGYDIDGYNRKGFNRNNIHKITGKEYDEQFFGNDDLYWEKQMDGSRRKTDRVYNEQMFDRKGYLYEIDKLTGKVTKKGQTYNEYGFLSNGIHHKTRTFIDPEGYDINGIWHKRGYDGKYTSTGSIFNDKGWTRDKKTLRHNVYGVTVNKNGEPFLDFVDDYGFDYRGRYHKPVDPIDKDGFVEFHKDIIMYTDQLYYQNNLHGTHYDIHHFDRYGICSKTGTFLNEYNFDRNGYFWKEDDNGELYNTYSYFNDEGWTIDKKKFIKNQFGELLYSSANERGFTIDRLYKPSLRSQSKKYDENGFDYLGINYSTGTFLDENNFDRDGYWWKEENGQLIRTNSLFDSEGWSIRHVNKETNTHKDIHGFDYLHLYRYPSQDRRKEGRISEYDPHGFNYLGIHRVTGKPYNKNYFDIDGYWYKKEGSEYVKTDSKFDERGYDINRRNKYGFTQNGYYKKTRKRFNENGFMVNGINIYTDRPYSLEGLDIDGNPYAEVDWDLIKEIKEQNRFNSRVYIEDIIAEFTEYEDLLESYNEVTEEFEDIFGTLELFISKVQARGVKHNEEPYTDEEEIIQYIKRDYLRRKIDKYKTELRRQYMSSEYLSLIDDGTLSDSDIDDVVRFGSEYMSDDDVDPIYLYGGPDIEKEDVDSIFRLF